jgi:hypothetical protein
MRRILQQMWLSLELYVVLASLLFSVSLLAQAPPRADTFVGSTGPKVKSGPSIKPVVGQSAMELEGRGRVGQIVDPQERIQMIARECGGQELTNCLLCLG